jgi:hypothetical protein
MFAARFHDLPTQEAILLATQHHVARREYIVTELCTIAWTAGRRYHYSKELELAGRRQNLSL